MSDVFISYSRRDSDFAKRLTNRLAQAQREVWIDWEDIPRAADWLQEIFAGIEGANTLVFIVSRHSLKSEICNYEVEYALKFNKRIIPLIREEITGEIEAEISAAWDDVRWAQIARDNWTALKHLNWIFFNDDADFEQEFAALLTALEQDLDYIKSHTRLLVRAREWENRGRNPSLLLTGDQINEAEAWFATPPKGGNAVNPNPTALHEAYIIASRKAENERKRVEKERLTQIETLGRRTNQFRLASALLGVLILIAVFVVILAVLQLGVAQGDANVANTQVFVAGATLTPVDPTLAAANAQLMTATLAQGEAQSRADSANTQVAVVGATLTPVESTLAAADAQLITATVAQGEAQSRADSANTQVAVVGATLTPVESTLAAADARLITATVAQGEAQSRADSANTQVAVVGATLTPVESTLAAADAQVVSALQTLTPIPATLTQAAIIVDDSQVREDISTNFADAMLDIQQGEAEDAENVMLTIAQTYSDEPLAWLTLGLVQAEIRDFDKAVESYTQALLLDPVYLQAYLNRSLAYEGRGDIDLAIADLTTILEIEPDNINALLNRGTIYNENGNPQAAIEDFTRIIALEPDNLGAYLNRGSAYDEIADYDAAIADYARAIELAPDDPRIYNNRAISYESLGDADAALADYALAIQLDADYAEPYFNRATYYISISQYTLAIADFDRYLELVPDDSSAYAGRAWVYASRAIENLDNVEAAFRDLNRALDDWDQAEALGYSFRPEEALLREEIEAIVR